MYLLPLLSTLNIHLAITTNKPKQRDRNPPTRACRMRRKDSKGTGVSPSSPFLHYFPASKQPALLTPPPQPHKINLARRSPPRRRPRCLKNHSNNPSRIPRTRKWLGRASLRWSCAKVVPVRASQVRAL